MIEPRQLTDCYQRSDLPPNNGQVEGNSLAVSLWQEFRKFFGAELQALARTGSLPPTVLAPLVLEGEPIPTNIFQLEEPPEEVLSEPEETSFDSSVAPFSSAFRPPLDTLSRINNRKRPTISNKRLFPRRVGCHSQAKAVPSFHLTGQAALDAKQNEPTLAKETSFDKIAAVISRHEGRADSINWNDHGAGVSAGIFQANQKRGELPLLLSRMQKADAKLFARIFGENFADLVKRVPEAIRTINFTDASGKAPSALGLQLEESLKQPLFQQVQMDMLRAKIRHASAVAAEYDIKSERGIALVTDLINQLGEGGDGRHSSLSGARRYLNFARSQMSQSAKIAAIVAHDFKGYGRAERDRDIVLDKSLDV